MHDDIGITEQESSKTPNHEQTPSTDACDHYDLHRHFDSSRILSGFHSSLNQELTAIFSCFVSDNPKKDRVVALLEPPRVGDRLQLHCVPHEWTYRTLFARCDLTEPSR